jgi:hypothetical protein
MTRLFLALMCLALFLAACKTAPPPVTPDSLQNPPPTYSDP